MWVEVRELGVWVFAQVRDNSRSGDERSKVFGTDFWHRTNRICRWRECRGQEKVKDGHRSSGFRKWVMAVLIQRRLGAVLVWEEQ